jgi:flagellar protein FlbD
MVWRWRAFLVLRKYRRTKGIPLVSRACPSLELQVNFPVFSSIWTLPSTWATPMIRLTRLNHVPIILNAELIEHIDMTPDTIVTLTSGQKYTVLESADEVVDKVIVFRQKLLSQDPARLTAPREHSAESESRSR